MLVVEKPLPRYVPPPPSKENLEYADLAIIDLSKATAPEGRVELSRQVCEALTEVGFFYIINHGYTSAQTSRIFDIANATFDLVSDEEKQEYTQKDVGVYTGYKPRNDWHIASGVRDAIEHYNINRHVVTQSHPQALRPFVPEIAAFASHNHLNVLHPILRHANPLTLYFPLLMALGLELPEDTLTKLHEFQAPGESSVRFMKYHPREATEEELTNSVWLKGHADIGSITILYSQPIGGLQILSRDNQWRWIKHIDNALVVNAGDAIEFLSGGYYKATRHRVIQPPADQRSIPRLGVFYFSMANDDAKLNPLLESPVLQRIGTTKYFEEGEAPTMEQWRRNRTALYGKSQLKPSEKEVGVEEEVIHGTVVKHYN
ncbi:Clavaminate synthase-like protein [Pleurotus eryngii]|uniref:Clavaminate synthase-like protein n=1 Tax=Pleurotus eryngii TaxID=5323 RepID=A0A9P5ZH81_PLEER|nr:Clavaminate synthase-like protein [Pleurotus eryngii]